MPIVPTHQKLIQKHGDGLWKGFPRRYLEGLSSTQLDELANDQERYRILTDLPYFCREYLGYEDISDVHEELDQWIAGKLTVSNTLLIMMARGHLKSSFITVARSTQKILDLQNTKGIIFNVEYGKSVEFLEEIKNHLANPRLLELFGPGSPHQVLWESPGKDTSRHCGVPIWREDAILLYRTRTLAGPTVRVNSIYGKMTGKHCDWCVVDDPQDDDNTQTEEQQKKLKTKLRNARKVLDPHGERIYIGTPWLKDDALAWIESLGFPTWRRSAVVDAETGKNARIPMDPEDDHKYRVVFPKKFNMDILREQKKEDGQYFASCQLEVDPLPVEAMRIQEEWIKYSRAVPGDLMRVYILCDPALSLAQRDDPAVILVALHPSDEQQPIMIYKSEEVRDSVQGLVDRLFQDYRYWQSRADTMLAVETGAYQGALKQWVEKDMNRYRTYFPVEELKPQGRRKEVRIDGMQPMIQNGGVEFHPENCKRLIYQLVNRGMTTHDDHADIFAYLPDVLIGGEIGVYDGFAVVEDGDPYSPEAILAQDLDDWRNY